MMSSVRAWFSSCRIMKCSHSISYHETIKTCSLHYSGGVTVNPAGARPAGVSAALFRNAWKAMSEAPWPSSLRAVAALLQRCRATRTGSEPCANVGCVWSVPGSAFRCCCSVAISGPGIQVSSVFFLQTAGSSRSCLGRDVCCIGRHACRWPGLSVDSVHHLPCVSAGDRERAAAVCQAGPAGGQAPFMLWGLGSVSHPSPRVWQQQAVVSVLAGNPFSDG